MDGILRYDYYAINKTELVNNFQKYFQLCIKNTSNCTALRL